MWLPGKNNMIIYFKGHNKLYLVNWNRNIWI